MRAAKTWALAVFRTVAAVLRQLLLWVDQGGNVILCGLAAIVEAACTGREQAPGYCDETLSAHAWRSSSRPLGRFFVPIIDYLWSRQRPDAEVNERAGRVVTSHCERAFEKEVLRREMPPAYREQDLKERPKP